MEVYRYTLPLKAPLPLGTQTLTERQGLLVRTDRATEHEGWGDIAPLPGFSRESLDSIVETLRELDGFPESRHREASVKFGVSCACVPFMHYLESLPVNALLAGEPDEVLAGAIEAEQSGYCAVKIKLGHLAPAEAAELVRTVRDRIGDQVLLRLDANRAWTLEQAVTFESELGKTVIEYIEEPVRDIAQLETFLAASTLPVAMDESLLDMPESKLPRFQKVTALVLKPTLLGGDRLNAWIEGARMCGMKIVFSSAFESGVGILGIARLATMFTAEPAGLDTYRWLERDVIDPMLRIENGMLDLSALKPEDYHIDVSGMERIV